MDEADRSARADGRRLRAVMRKATLASREHDFDPIAGPAAISLVTRLTEESWSLTGRAWPNYSRGETPWRFVPWRPK